MENLIPYLVPAVIVVIVVLLLLLGYVKAPPDMAYIISGVKKKSKVVIGKASIRIPFFERLDKLNLRLIPIDVKTSNAVPTADYININVDATVNVKISNDPEKLRLAAENFLNKNTEYIASVAREVLEGNVREIVGKMRLEEMVSDRQKFANLVKENAEPDLAAMGLDIISFNVQNFVDGNDVIENLGIDNIVKIKKSAAIAKAESERDIKVAQAAADKESNDAAVEAQTEIAKKQNELAIKKSELQMEADTKKAMADAAYEIQKEEQRKTIEVTTANADIAKQEREIELKQKQVAVTEQSLEAEVKKKAEAEKYAAQQRAEAELYQRQKDAEAKQFEAQREAEAQKAQAEAMRRNADKWRKNKKENNIPTVVIWLWGNSDTGKTSMAKEMATSSGQPYYLSGSSRGMWDNYDSNMHIAILDECRPEMFETYRDMLSILDPYQERAVAPARYYDRELALDTIIITSVYDPYAFYKHMIEPEKRNVDSFRQLERRITYSIHVEDYFFMLSHFEDKEVGYVNDVDTLIANPYSKVKRGEIVISDRNRNYSNLMHALPSVSQHDNIDESYYCNADGEEDEMQLYEDVSDQLEACEAWKEAQDNAMLEEEQYQSGIGGEKESEDAHDEDDNNRGEYDEYDETNERIYDEHEKNKLESEKYAEDELEKEDWQKKDIKEIE